MEEYKKSKVLMMDSWRRPPRESGEGSEGLVESLGAVPGSDKDTHGGWNTGRFIIR